MLGKLHLPLSIDEVTAVEWVLDRLIDSLECIQVVVDHFKLIGDHATILDHWQEKQAKQRVDHVDAIRVSVELAVREV